MENNTVRSRQHECASVNKLGIAAEIGSVAEPRLIIRCNQRVCKVARRTTGGQSTKDHTRRVNLDFDLSAGKFVPSANSLGVGLLARAVESMRRSF